MLCVEPGGVWGWGGGLSENSPEVLISKASDFRASSESLAA
jgi:hypothetical protein